MTPETSVYDYAFEYAVTRGWFFVTSEAIVIGVMHVDAVRPIVTVHPESATVTLHTNTTRSALLPPNETR